MEKCMVVTRYLFAIFTISVLQGCSYESMYYAGRANLKNQCGQYIEKEEYDVCMGQANESYSEYEEKRKEAASDEK